MKKFSLKLIAAEAKALWHDKPKRNFYLAISAIVLSGSALLFFILQTSNTTVDNGFLPTFSDPEPSTYASPLTGIKVTNESLVKRPVTAVMIENSPEARPHSGLKQAGVVYEAVAEGGITRFLALYQESKPELIGPVRSLRPYYVEWAGGYDAAIAHVGGSARSLDMVRSGDYGVDIDQFFNADAYYRSSDRFAPHNVYTTTDRLDALLKSKNKTSSNFTGFARVDEPTELPEPTAKTVNIPVSSGQFSVRYDYNAEANNYKRIMGGEPHMDREKGAIAPKVVVALTAKQSSVFEDGNRESYDVTGSNTAVIFQNGQVIKGRWSKPDGTSALRLTDADGNDIELVRGQTWLTVVPEGKAASWQ